MIDGKVNQKLLMPKLEVKVHMKRNMSKGERLDKLIKSAEEGETVVDKYGVLNYLEAPREVWK